MIDPERQTEKARIDWDVRGILAILAVVGAFSLAFVQLLFAPVASAEIPAWAAAVVSGVTGFYFGSRSSGGEST